MITEYMGSDFQRDADHPQRERNFRDHPDSGRDVQADRESQRSEKLAKDTSAGRKDTLGQRATGNIERARTVGSERSARATGAGRSDLTPEKKKEGLQKKEGWKTHTIKEVTRVSKAINNTIVESGLGLVFDKAKQTSGALALLGEQYQQLLEDGPMSVKTKSQIYDKYRHCLGHCGAAKEGIVGLGISLAVGVGREATEWFSESNATKSAEVKWADAKSDFGANFRGNSGMLNGLRCEAVCAEYREPWQK